MKIIDLSEHLLAKNTEKKADMTASAQENKTDNNTQTQHRSEHYPSPHHLNRTLPVFFPHHHICQSKVKEDHIFPHVADLLVVVVLDNKNKK
jgi:hypothetical protein